MDSAPLYLHCIPAPEYGDEVLNAGWTPASDAAREESPASRPHMTEARHAAPADAESFLRNVYRYQE